MAAPTDEEKRGLVHSALDKYQQAQALVDQANKMMEKCGIKMCGVTVFGDAYEEETMQNLHVFSGIKKLAKLFDEETRNPLDIFKDPQKSQLGIVIDKVLFYQLGDA